MREKEKETLNQQKKNGNEYNELDREGVMVASRVVNAFSYYIFTLGIGIRTRMVTIRRLFTRLQKLILTDAIFFFYNLSIKRAVRGVVDFERRRETDRESRENNSGVL